MIVGIGFVGMLTSTITEYFNKSNESNNNDEKVKNRYAIKKIMI